MAEIVDLGDSLLQVLLEQFVFGYDGHDRRVLSSRLARPFLDLRRPLERLQVYERPWPAYDLGAAQADQELLGALEAAHSDAAGADSLQHVRVRAGAHGQVVFARKTKRLVVEGLEDEPGVIG